MIGAFYEDALQGRDVDVEYSDGTVRPLGAERWLRPIAGDQRLLARCDGPTLDVGSGPGRLTAALAGMGVPVLGIDVTPLAVALTRRAGAPALCRNVFEPLPGTGRWAVALLADGNIGIGGNPEALLRRLRELVRPGGAVITELAPPGSPSGVDRVRLRRGGRAADWFTWATVSADDIGPLARRCGFPSVEPWHEAGRWFATLT
ncbi:methyltransferase type 12 [Sphaerisporangium melleum]|uniref:Methyltransferase type 12 n=1 Tax=Sphaerisporangium melleum TaxID=321316 RepID=A0A917QX35_9ACTN|nr:methyltransferase domain-containing protein [Sphaerisporangium melleum]GGK75056.1 methyltransferase type 12 [Sphaerisporangium melleum]GII70994.1 methyltransferase type 12 [Sphaerisporangium melleum]